MIRFFISTILFFVVFVFETSFLSSLPWFFPSVPFVFGLSVYLIQHEGIVDGAVWIFAFGLLFDIAQLNGLSVSTAPAIAASVAALLSARHLFSNRSFYGMIACAFCSYTVWILVDSIIIFIRLLSSPMDDFWRQYFIVHGYRLLLLVLFVGIMFVFGQRMRGVIYKLFVTHKWYY